MWTDRTGTNILFYRQLNKMDIMLKSRTEMARTGMNYEMNGPKILDCGSRALAYNNVV